MPWRAGSACCAPCYVRDRVDDAGSTRAVDAGLACFTFHTRFRRVVAAILRKLADEARRLGVRLERIELSARAILADRCRVRDVLPKRAGRTLRRRSACAGDKQYEQIDDGPQRRERSSRAE